MSPVRVTTSGVDARERADLVRSLVWDNLVRVELDYDRPDSLSVELTLGQADDLTVCTAEATATTIRRTASLIRDDAEPCVFFGVQMSGTSMVIQHDREVVLKPGDMALYDASLPYTLVNGGGVHQAYFRIPQSALGVPHRAITSVSATRLDGPSPVAQIAASYFAGVAQRVQDLDNGLDQLAAPSIALAKAVILSQLGQSPASREAVAVTLVTQALEYAGKHLGDRDLCAERVAAHLHVSVRHLYKVLEAAQIGFSDWVRRERLERCRLELSQADAPPVAVVASRWGFTEASHFSRVFRQAYDMSPPANSADKSTMDIVDDTESDLIPFAVTASDHCGIHAALNIVGQKWALLIVRDVMSGITRFDHLRRHLGVSETVLSNRLRAMVHSGLLSQQEYAAPKERPRFEYVLTDAGWDLFPVLTALKRWGERHTELADGPYWMVEHAQCGARVTAQIACDSGHSPIPLTEISGRVGSVTAGVIDSEH